MCYVDWPKGMDLVTFVDSNVAVQLWISILLERKLTKKTEKYSCTQRILGPVTNAPNYIVVKRA